MARSGTAVKNTSASVVAADALVNAQSVALTAKSPSGVTSTQVVLVSDIPSIEAALPLSTFTAESVDDYNASIPAPVPVAVAVPIPTAAPPPVAAAPAPVVNSGVAAGASANPVALTHPSTATTNLVSATQPAAVPYATTAHADASGDITSEFIATPVDPILANQLANSGGIVPSEGSVIPTQTAPMATTNTAMLLIAALIVIWVIL